MITNSLPDIFSSSAMSRNIMQLRERLTATSNEAVTGQRFDQTKHLNGRIGQAMMADRLFTSINTEKVHLTLTANRFEMAQLGLKTINSLSQDLPARVLTDIGSDNIGTFQAVVQEAKAALEQVFATMNTKSGNRYLYAGVNTNTAPYGDVSTLLDDLNTIILSSATVNDININIDAYFTNPNGGFFQNVYAGSIETSNALPLTGANEEIVGIVKNLALLSLADTGSNLDPFAGDDSIVRNAAIKLGAELNNLTTTAASLGYTELRVQERLEVIDKEEIILASTLREFIGRDQYEAAAELKDIELQLEAAYTLTSRLSNLSLVNYLR